MSSIAGRIGKNMAKNGNQEPATRLAPNSFVDIAVGFEALGKMLSGIPANLLEYQYQVIPLGQVTKEQILAVSEKTAAETKKQPDIIFLVTAIGYHPVPVETESEAAKH